MFGNYLKSAWRNIQQNKLHTVFNLSGLSMGIGCCIAVFLFLDTVTHCDTFHRNADKIFMIGHVKSIGDRDERWGLSPAALAPALKAGFPEVRKTLRIDDAHAVIKYGDKVFNETIWLSDPSFFDILTFPLKAGDPKALEDRSSIFLNEETAAKYFGDEDPINKTLTVIFDNTHKYDFVVRGVAEKFPRNASFSFSFLVNYEVIKNITADWQNWNYNVWATFVELESGSQASRFESAIQRLAKTYNGIVPERPIQSFYLDNLLDISKHSYNVRADISSGSNPHGLTALATIAALLLLMACFNFMNNTIAAAAKRFKEIGIRKVIGSSRWQLIGQFLSENMAVSFLALVTGLIAAEVLFIPFLNILIDSSGPSQLKMEWKDTSLISFLGALVLGIGIVSGLYPALYMSRFQPVKILKDLQRVGGKRILTRMLLVLQFAISLFAIFSAIVFKQNADYMRAIDLGFKGDQVATFYFDNSSQFASFKNAVASHPGVGRIAGSLHQFGRSFSAGVAIDLEGKKFQSNILKIGTGYLETLGVEMVQGRSFDAKMKTDINEAVIVSEKLVRQYDLQNPIGRRMRVEGKEYTIVGVSKDFYQRSFVRGLEPCVLRLIDENEYRIMSVKIRMDQYDALRPFFQKQWAALIPESPFEMRFQDQVFEDDFREVDNIRIMFIYIAAMTAGIAAMGLFALVSLNIARRTKEIGIRKVLGASAAGIIQLINKEFYYLILAAGVFIYPIALLLITGLLDSVYQGGHTEISAVPFLGSLAAMLILAALTVGSRVYKVAVENPVNALKYE